MILRTNRVYETRLDRWKEEDSEQQERESGCTLSQGVCPSCGFHSAFHPFKPLSLVRN